MMSLLRQIVGSSHFFRNYATSTSREAKQDIQQVFRFGRKNPRWNPEKHLPPVQRPKIVQNAQQTVDTPYKYYKVTLRRGLIGVPKRIRSVVATLRLRRRERSVFVPVTPNAAGKLLKVKELISLENHVDLPADVGKRQRHPLGYSIVGSMLKK